MRGVVFLATMAMMAGCSFSVGLGPQPPPPDPAGGGGIVGSAPGGALPAPLDGGIVTSGPDLAPVRLGAPCAVDADCGGMVCVHGVPGHPDGYCTVACGDGAPKCPMGSMCADVGDQKYCVAGAMPKP